jgi:high-affinity Fe2+/Pb2+ permease
MKDQTVGNVEPQDSKSGNSIRFPLSFSFAMGAVAGVVTMVVSAGGLKHGLRWDLGGIAFGIAFIASLLISSLLVMGHKENPAYLSEGSGVNRKSSDRLAAARAKSEEAAKAASADNGTEGAAGKNHDGGPSAR